MNTPAISIKFLTAVGLLFLVGIFSIYFPAFQNDFLDWDDDIFVKNNLDIQALNPQNIRAMFTSNKNNVYIPLTYLSWALEILFFGLKPFVFIFNNVLLHFLNTFLVFLILNRLTRNRFLALTAGILFGLHPIHVESVVWITERKDVLYAFFYLLSLYYFHRYLDRPIKKPGNFLLHPSYMVSLFCFVLALFSKGQAVTLAPVLVLIMWYERKRVFSRQNMWEAGPFFILAAGFGILTLVIMGILDRSTVELYPVPVLIKFLYGSYSLAHYVIRTVIPFNLVPVYPEFYQGIPGVFWLYTLSVPLYVLAMFICRKSRIVLLGLLFFLLNILPLLEITSTGNVIAADRFSYVPGMGIILVITVFFHQLLKRVPRGKFVVLPVLLAYMVFLGIYTGVYTTKWKDTETLFLHSLDYYPDSPVALNKMAAMRLMNQDILGAYQFSNAALKVFPGYEEAYINRSITRTKLGDMNGALKDCKIAIKINPRSADAHNNIANILAMGKQYDLAGDHLQTAMDLDPKNYEPHASLGNILAGKGDFTGAIASFDRAIQLNPGDPRLYNSRGSVWMRSGENQKAMCDYNRALELDPDLNMARFNRALIRTKQDESGKALEDLLYLKQHAKNLPSGFNVFLADVEKKVSRSKPIPAK